MAEYDLADTTDRAAQLVRAPARGEIQALADTTELRGRLYEALVDVRSKLNDCLHGQINWRPEDWIETIDAALSSGRDGRKT